MSPNTDPNPIDRLMGAANEPVVRAELEDQLARDPAPLFHRALEILAYDNPVSHPVDLEFRTNQEAALTTHRIGGFWRKRYVTTINAGFYHLLSDVTEINVGWSLVVSKHRDEVLAGPSFTLDEMLEILREAVVQYVSDSNRWTPSPKLAKSNRERLLQEFRKSSRYRRSAVHFGRRLFMVMFALAHELGHIVKRHCDPPAIFTRRRTRLHDELDADRVAAKYLLDCLRTPPLWRVQPLPNIWNPAELLIHSAQLREIQLRYFNWFGPNDEFPASPYRISLVNALTSVAMLFSIYDLTERAALAIHRPSEHQYPPASERYLSFRTTCINDLDVPAEAFTEFGYGGGSPPDEFLHKYRELTERIAGELSA